MDKKSQKRTKTFYALLAGLTSYILVGLSGLYLLSTVWTDYALASKNKSYTFEMKLSRLFIGVLAAVFAGIVPTLIANDRGKTAWFVGVIIFCFAACNHFFLVWTDYPAWYHFSYLLPIIPITGLSHYLVSRIRFKQPYHRLISIVFFLLVVEPMSAQNLFTNPNKTVHGKKIGFWSEINFCDTIDIAAERHLVYRQHRAPESVVVEGFYAENQRQGLDYIQNGELDNEPDFEDAMTIQWWLNTHINIKELLPALQQFSELQQWTVRTNGLRSFGDAETNDLSVCFDHQTNQVQELSCRLDLRQIDKSFVEKALILAIRFDCLLMDRQGGLYEPTIENLVDKIQRSNAGKFVDDPKQFLEDLHKGIVTPE